MIVLAKLSFTLEGEKSGRKEGGNQQHYNQKSRTAQRNPPDPGVTAVQATNHPTNHASQCVHNPPRH